MGKTKPSQIAEEIQRDYVESGILPPGGQLPSVRDLQRIYQASSTAIAHALSMLEARGLIWKRHGKGCFISDAKDERETTARTDAIGLVIPLPASESLLMRLFLGVEAVCNRTGHSLMVGTSGWEYRQEREQVHRLIDAGCKAIVVNPVFRLREQLADDYLMREELGVPVVMVDMAPDGYPHSRVLMDNYRAGYDMTRLLQSRGHRHIAFMAAYCPTGELLHRSNHERLEGYSDAMRQSGVSIREQNVWRMSATPWLDNADIARHLRGWREQSERATAVITIDDHCAADTVAEARRLDIDVPGDLAVAGFDNLPVGESIHPPFPTTGTDFATAGEVAAQLALRHISGRLSEPVTYLLPIPLLPRDPSEQPTASSRLEPLSHTR